MLNVIKKCLKVIDRNDVTNEEILSFNIFVRRDDSAFVVIDSIEKSEWRDRQKNFFFWWKEENENDISMQI